MYYNLANIIITMKKSTLYKPKINYDYNRMSPKFENQGINKNLNYLSRILNSEHNAEQKIINLTTITSEVESEQDNYALELAQSFVENINNKIMIIPIIMQMKNYAIQKQESMLTDLLCEYFEAWLEPYIETYLTKEMRFYIHLQKNINKLGVIFFKIMEKEQPNIIDDLVKNNINHLQFIRLCYSQLLTNILDEQLFKQFLFQFIQQKWIFFIYFLVKFLSTKACRISQVKSIKQLCSILKRESSKDKQRIILLLKNEMQEQMIYSIKKLFIKLEF